MSDPANDAPQQQQPRSGWLTALMVVTGTILLLPGLCALVVGAVSINDPIVSTFLPLILVCLLIGFGGIMLLRAAFRGRRR
ncbi:hypothetical protein [Rhodopseudomonas sp. P2A-2r]|uniref:hypothetical protein n=1 Tax=unclassified Rhodopseudomonas TaxID=2638247 RepID=UPI0022349541|nr:hypothetical protein [Rhodopseudomonas sp. P2A-2r]UZE49620.1 hypothetical protein ONR75_01970 [Rhodopseudomonas sp. P2A-2r]